MITTLLTLTLLGQAHNAAVTAQTGGSCAVQSTSRGDTLINPTTGSDERFFSRPNGAPNILILLDTSAGAMGFPHPLPTAAGCVDADFGVGYDSATPYEPVIKKVDATGWPSNTNDYNDKWFKDIMVYQLPANGNMGDNLKDDPTVPSWSDTSNACATDTACTSCLDTKGYYRRSTGEVIARGRFLNYAGPRYVGVSQVYSHIVRDVQGVRFAVMASSDWEDNEWRQPDSNLQFSMVEPFWPSCNKSYDSNKKFSDTDTTNQRNSVLNNISNDDSNEFVGNNKLAAMLYGAGWYYASRSPFPPQAFPSTAGTWPEPHSSNDGKWKEGSNNQRSVCDACVYSSIIVLNASAVDENNDLGIAVPNFATTIGGASAPNCDAATNPRCNSKADELAAWLYRNDFRADYGGAQRVTTYVINTFNGTNTTDFLRNVARMGGGQYFAAGNNVALKQAVLDAIADISNRGQTFATSAVTSIQTGQLSLTQLVPRMYPQRNLPWNGELYRFAQKNEFVLEQDLNGDGDQSDVFVVDRDDDVVVEASDGYFKKAGSYSNLTTTLTDGGITQDANPFWEASKVLADGGWENRNIWTVVDRNDGRASFTHEDRFVEFKSANWSELIHTLGLEKSKCPNGTDRGDIFERLNLTVSNAATLVSISTPTSDSGRWELCARVVIDWVRGRDIGDEDGDGDRDESRPSMLADVFHSSPVVVEPPVEKFICDLGISNQCGKTLYTDSLPVVPATQLDTTGSWNDPLCDKSDGTDIVWTDPYDIWRARQRARDRLVVVGSNGGMLHAFNNGKLTAQTCSGVAWSGTWNQGTGEEEWAFIPPDLLPKLQDMIVNGHEYFVDGDVMVKDIWADGSGSSPADGKKQWDEFHTMVVGAEGRGGTHYFALELIFPANTNTASASVSAPSTAGRLSRPLAGNSVRPFRWIFPQPGTIEATRFGKTLFTLNPKPPPIGPVLIEDSSSFTPTRYSVKAREAWVVMLTGGWAPGLNRGRGVYMVDAFWGLVNGREDNLYWKAEFDDAASGDKNAPLDAMTGSFAAPVAMADYGSHDTVTQDGFFDTAVVGDTIGQVWVARFFKPGKIVNGPTGLVGGESASSTQAANASAYISRATPGIVGNWSIARAFEMDKNATFDGDYKPMTNVQPFFYLPSLAIEPATLALRAFLGSGNRYALLEPYSGLCRWDNPMACAKYGCDDVRVDLDIERAPVEIEGQWNRWDDRKMDVLSNDRIEDMSTPETRTYCQPTVASPLTAAAELHYEEYEINDCDQGSGGDKDYGGVNEVHYLCGDQSGFGFGCYPNGTISGRKVGDLNFSIDTSNANATGKDRYYGLWVYGGSRYFDETAAEATGPYARQFDTARLTDRGSSDLVNVTNVTCTAAGACTGASGTGTFGWWLEYSGHGMKTATGSAIIASCVVWSSLVPGAAIAGGTEACATSVASSNFFQADFVTGEPNCAAGFANPDGGANFRFLTRDVLTPPPEPATIVQISASGKIRYSAQLPEPGKGTQFQVDVVSGGDVLQSVYELPLTRSTHECRHVQGGSCAPVP